MLDEDKDVFRNELWLLVLVSMFFSFCAIGQFVHKFTMAFIKNLQENLRFGIICRAREARDHLSHLILVILTKFRVLFLSLLQDHFKCLYNFNSF